MERVSTVGRLVCGRWSKWVVLAVWIALAAAAGPLAGKMSGVQTNETAEWLPGGAEATQVFYLLQRFPTTESVPAIIIYERESGTTPADLARATDHAAAIAGLDGVAGPVTGPIPAADGRALQLIVPVEMGDDGWSRSGDRIDAIRAVTGPGADGLTVFVAGPASAAADQATAFAGTDGTLLLATLAIVTIILLLAYRSPVLWLLPIMTAGLALSVSQAVIYLLASNTSLTVNGQSAAILMVMVFGAGTDYALLLIARYREELRRDPDRHAAMAVAVRRSGPAVLASAATIVLALLCLMFAEMNSTAGLGPVVAIGIVVGLLAALTLLPALLVIFGRWLFWPAIPRSGTVDRANSGLWARLGPAIARRPRTVWVGTALVLAIASIGVVKLDASGLGTADSFVNRPPSVVGQEALGRHFPAGKGQPVVVIGNATAATELRAALAATPGITDVTEPVTADGLVSIEGTLQAGSDTPAARATVDRVRDAVHAVPGADGRVGGATALQLDLNRANANDNRLIIPIVLLVVLLVLGLLLRAVVAPLVLIATVVLSFGAALGISAVVFEEVFGFKGTDSGFPLFVFVWLVALGIDYNIFLMTRVREESRRHGPKQGALIGLAATGGVITSAGLVLAGTFAALASLPLVFFAELGFAVALGILLDTIIVRSVLVTALSLDLGRWMWWPGRLAAPPRPPAGAQPQDQADERRPALIS